MATRALQQFRHPCRRWLALWAVLAMLLNQIAIAEHLCRATPGLHGTHSTQVSDSQGPSLHSHMSPDSMGSALPDLNQIACGAHCDDADKQLRDLVSPVFPALAGGSAEIALLRLDRNSGPARYPRTADAIRDHHGSIYRVLLI